jgi:hypothetical protein
MTDGSRTRIYLKPRHEKYNTPWLNLSGFVQTMLDLLVVPEEEIPEDERPEMPMVPAPLSQAVSAGTESEANPLSETDAAPAEMDQTEAARLVLAATAGLNNHNAKDPGFSGDNTVDFADKESGFADYQLGISRRLASRGPDDPIPAFVVPFDPSGEGLTPDEVDESPPSVAGDEPPPHAEGRETAGGHVLAESEEEPGGGRTTEVASDGGAEGDAEAAEPSDSSDTGTDREASAGSGRSSPSRDSADAVQQE